MVVKCLYNHGKSVKDINNYQFYSDHAEFNLLKIGKNYHVSGIVYWNGVIHYLIDDDEWPGTFPEFLFELVDNNIPSGWFFNSRPHDNDARILMGFKEFCFDEKYYNDLGEGEKYTFDIYFKRKKELYPNSNMNLKELKIKLDELGISPSIYSLNGDLSCNGLILYNSYREWIVFYMDERGNRHDEKIFYSESDACLYLYEYYQNYKKIFMNKK